MGYVAVLLFAIAILGLIASWFLFGEPHRAAPGIVILSLPALKPVGDEQVRELCSRCHHLPGPDVLPKSAWPKTIWLMSTFSGFGANVQFDVQPEAVVDWFIARAPDVLDLRPVEASQRLDPLRLKRRDTRIDGSDDIPFVSNVLLADLLGSSRPEIVVCDMKSGAILMGETDQPDWSLKPIGNVPFPAHAEAVDLDADGRMDLVVAALGSFSAMDHKLGSVQWLRQVDNGRFERHAIAEDLARVSDVQPADLDSDGDVDLVVAEFGWRTTGHLILLENRTEPGGKPAFVQLPIEGNHGASHAAITDLDGDGSLDILTLYSQEIETVRCYFNRKGGWTEFLDLYRAPHPAWGHSGFEVVDIDGDGDADVLLTNGDTYDNSLLKPYHGVRWLENRGGLEFVPHELVTMYGAYRAEAADMDGDGDADIVVCALAEQDNVDAQVDLSRFESLLWLEQVEPGRFVHHTLEVSRSHHPNLTLGDYDLDGDIDVFVGNGQFDDTGVPPGSSVVDIWENQLR